MSMEECLNAETCLNNQGRSDPAGLKLLITISDREWWWWWL